MDLKDYKRVSSGNEFRDVVQTSDTEPRYRSNGHQLELNASNSDYLEINDSNDLQVGESIEVLIDFDNNTTSDIYFLGSSNFANCGITFDPINNRSFVRDNLGNEAFVLIGLFNNGDIFKIERTTATNYRFYAGDNFQDVDGSFVGGFNINQITRRTSLGTNTLRYLNYKDESFNFTNINSNAQIEGSNGTIAQVNSSAADPINYILGTVFQKRGFALAFDKLNKENIKFDEIELTEGDSWNIKVQFLENKDLYIYSVDFFGTNKSRLVIFGALLQGVLVDNLGNSFSFNYAFSLETIHNIELKRIGGNLLIEIDGNQVLNQVFSNSFIINSINNRDGNIVYSTSFLLNGFSFNSESFDLKRGLGVELIGSNGTTAEIKTSAANPQQRVNFGMWQKNGNVLKFNASNSDYIDLGDNPNISNLSELQLKTKITFENGNFGSRQLFSIGNNFQGFDRVLFYLSDRSVGLVIGVNGATVEAQFTTISSTFGTITSVFEFKNLELIVDGVVKKTFATDWALDFSNTPSSRPFTYSIENNNQLAFTNTTEYIEVQGEQFLFREGNGLTTTSESGNTTATINTSAANPTEYIDTYVWNKDNNKFIDYKV